MMNLVFQADDKDAFYAFALDRGMAETVQDDEGNDQLAFVSGVDVAFWNGTGLMMVDPAEYDDEGEQTVAPAFAEGFWVLVRCSGKYLADNAVGADEDDEPLEEGDEPEAWEQLKVAKDMRTNAQKGLKKAERKAARKQERKDARKAARKAARKEARTASKQFEKNLDKAKSLFNGIPYHEDTGVRVFSYQTLQNTILNQFNTAGHEFA